MQIDYFTLEIQLQIKVRDSTKPKTQPRISVEELRMNTVSLLWYKSRDLKKKKTLVWGYHTCDM